MLQPHSASSCSPKVASPSADRTWNSFKAVPKVRKCCAFASAPLQCTFLLLDVVLHVQNSTQSTWIRCKGINDDAQQHIGLVSSGVTVMDHQNMLSDLLQLI
jgi:hypothetical protein